MLRFLLLIAVTAALAYPVSQNLWRLGGRFILEDHDHAEVMVAPAARAPARSVTVMFVGNSLTFVHDMPGMLANLAASDRWNATELRIKAFTASDAELQELRANSGAIAYAQANHVDVVVLQPHSGWSYTPNGVSATESEVWLWKNALESPTTQIVLFEGWGEETGSANFIDPNDPDNARRDWSMIEAGSAALSRDDHVAMVPVGDALYLATTRPGSPEVYESDHHHASESGAYLGALIWYRWLTGRDGVQAGYHPLDMSETTAQALVRLEQDTAAAHMDLFPRG
jgi:hypothetical protein